MQSERREQQHAIVRSRILREATYLFLTRGVRPVTMNLIAAQVGISKRTLYEQFADKESLLAESLVQLHRMGNRLYALAEDQGESRLERILQFHWFQNDILLLLEPRFFTDLDRYPSLLKTFAQVRRSESMAGAEYIKPDIEAGIFRADIDYTQYFFLLQEFIRTTVQNSRRDLKRLTQEVSSIVIINLRGMCTPKGAQMLEELIAHGTDRKPHVTRHNLRTMLAKL